MGEDGTITAQMKLKEKYVNHSRSEHSRNKKLDIAANMINEWKMREDTKKRRVH